MALERLIKREKPENVATAKVVQIDSSNKRIQVRSNSSVDLWVSYDPSTFSGISEGDGILVMKTGKAGFLLSTLTSGFTVFVAENHAFDAKPRCPARWGMMTSSLSLSAMVMT